MRLRWPTEPFGLTTSAPRMLRASSVHAAPSEGWGFFEGKLVPGAVDGKGDAVAETAGKGEAELCGVGAACARASERATMVKRRCVVFIVDTKRLEDLGSSKFHFRGIISKRL